MSARDAALAMQVVAAGRAVGAGDQQPAAAALGQQPRRLGQPVARRRSARRCRRRAATAAAACARPRCAKTTKPAKNARTHRAHGYGDTVCLPVPRHLSGRSPRRGQAVATTSTSRFGGLVTAPRATINRVSQPPALNAGCSECDKRRCARSACTARRSPARRCRAGNSRADRARRCRSGGGSRRWSPCRRPAAPSPSA